MVASVHVNRTTLYLTVNACFVALVLGASLLSVPSVPVHPVYLLLLFAVCSTPILEIRAFNDRYVLLALFSATYFVLYGLLDLTTLLFQAAEQPGADGLLAPEELVILIGGAIAQLAYRLACRSPLASGSRRDRDWSERTLVLAGASLWAICTWMTWQFRVYVIVDNSIETLTRGLGSLSSVQLIAIMLASYLQPMGIVILAYAQCRYRRPYLLLLLVGALLTEMVFGLVTDSKGQVLIGVVLVAITKLLVDGTVPKTRLIVAAAIIAVVFPVLQANRIAMGARGASHTEAAQNFTDTLERAIGAKSAAESGPDRAETVIERSSLKHSVAMIVSRTGRSVPFQNGYTLSPLLTVFVPRILWPGKPDVPTGRLVNKAFHVSDQAETNISPSHLGELYWNFGWPGVVIGMTCIGLLLGFLGARYDLSQAVTLTRVLILIATVKVLIMGFESVIAVQYSVWLRSMLAIGILHVLFAKMPATSQVSEPTRTGEPRSATPGGTARFPNLIR